MYNSFQVLIYWVFHVFKYFYLVAWRHRFDRYCKTFVTFSDNLQTTISDSNEIITFVTNLVKTSRFRDTISYFSHLPKNFQLIPKIPVCWTSWTMNYSNQKITVSVLPEWDSNVFFPSLHFWHVLAVLCQHDPSGWISECLDALAKLLP